MRGQSKRGAFFENGCIFFLSPVQIAGGSGKRNSCLKVKTAGTYLPGEVVFLNIHNNNNLFNFVI